MSKIYKSHGSGQFAVTDFARIGENVVFEGGVLVFHPENIELGSNIYVGHRTILKAYFKNRLSIGDDTWIGPNCYFHSAGGLDIGKRVGIGPNVQILTSSHAEEGVDKPILFSTLSFKMVIIEDDADIGIGSVILPGVTIGKGVQIGAGSVVTKSVPPYSVAFGNPARVVRSRK